MVSGRLPTSVDKKIRKLMSQYASNITSILSKFPHQQIANVIDGHAATLTRRADKDVFFMTSQGITQLIKRYDNSKNFNFKIVIFYGMTTFQNSIFYFDVVCTLNYDRKFDFTIICQHFSLHFK